MADNDGVALNSMAHPDTRPKWRRVFDRLFWWAYPAPRLDPSSIVTEEIDLGVAMAALPDDVKRDAIRYMTRILPTTAAPYVCYRCIPPHTLDWDNPCKSHQRKD